MSLKSDSSTAKPSSVPLAGLKRGTANDTSGPVGRFAPSPSGPLHFGSLITALASFLDVRTQQGQWLLRIDDLDAPRTTPGSEATILQTLEAHQLHWDGTPTRQSDHQPHYELALQELARLDLLFFCDCSRKSLKGATAYPGNCRHRRCNPAQLAAHLRTPPDAHDCAIRLQMPDRELGFNDQLQGPQKTHLAREGGDYIVLRRDGLVSYQLAVVVDDALTAVTQVVRGADLLPTTARQQHLHEQLGCTAPTWLHLPILLNQRNTKLSKQARSLAVTAANVAANLCIALQLLGQQPPPEATLWPAHELMDWAIANWSRDRLPAGESFADFYGW